MLNDIPVGETNLEKQSVALFFAPEIHSKDDIVGGEFQTPPVYLIICILAIKESMLEVYDHSCTIILAPWK